MESPRLKSKFKWPDQTLIGRCRPWATKNLLIYIFANFPKHLHSARIHKYSWGILIWNRSRSFMNNHYSTKLISCKISGAQHTYLPRNWTSSSRIPNFPICTQTDTIFFIHQSGELQMVCMDSLRRPVVLSRERTYIRLFRFLSPVRDCCHLWGYLTYSPGLNEDRFLRVETSFLDSEIKVHVRQFLPGKVCEQFKTFIGVSLFCDKFH